jgi:hypothetical protein
MNLSNDLESWSVYEKNNFIEQLGILGLRYASCARESPCDGRDALPHIIEQTGGLADGRIGRHTEVAAIPAMPVRPYNPKPLSARKPLKPSVPKRLSVPKIPFYNEDH